MKNRNDNFGAASRKENDVTMESLRAELRASPPEREAIHDLIRELIPIAKCPTLNFQKLPDAIVDAVFDTLTEDELCEIAHWGLWNTDVGTMVQTRMLENGIPAEVQKAIEDWNVAVKGEQP